MGRRHLLSIEPVRTTARLIPPSLLVNGVPSVSGCDGGEIPPVYSTQFQLRQLFKLG